jgi:hypothetical protein
MSEDVIDAEGKKLKCQSTNISLLTYSAYVGRNRVRFLKLIKKFEDF